MRLRRQRQGGQIAKAKSFDRLERKEKKGQLMRCRGKGLTGNRRSRRLVATMGNGDGRLHSTKADTSRCSLEMRDDSRDSRPSRTSQAGPAAPAQRPCTSTGTLDPWASMLVQHRAHVEPMSTFNPFVPPSTTKRRATPSSGFHPTFHTCSPTPPHLRPYPFLAHRNGSWLRE